MSNDLRITPLPLVSRNTFKGRCEPQPSLNSCCRSDNLVVASSTRRDAMERLKGPLGSGHRWENVRVILAVKLRGLRAVVIGLFGVKRLTLQTGSDNGDSLSPPASDLRWPGRGAIVTRLQWHRPGLNAAAFTVTAATGVAFAAELTAMHSSSSELVGST